MTNLDDDALKAEIDHISKKIDTIMKKVDQLYPSQTKPEGREKAVSQDKPLTSPDPTG